MSNNKKILVKTLYPSGTFYNEEMKEKELKSLDENLDKILFNVVLIEKTLNILENYSEFFD